MWNADSISNTTSAIASESSPSESKVESTETGPTVLAATTEHTLSATASAFHGLGSSQSLDIVSQSLTHRRGGASIRTATSATDLEGRCFGNKGCCRGS